MHCLLLCLRPILPKGEHVTFIAAVKEREMLAVTKIKMSGSENKQTATTKQNTASAETSWQFLV